MCFYLYYICILYFINLTKKNHLDDLLYVIVPAGQVCQYAGMPAGLLMQANILTNNITLAFVVSVR